jgi:hypothetical protein
MTTPNPYALTDLIGMLADNRELPCRDMPKLSALVTPRVNMNGNSKQSLVDMLVNVKHALDDADKAFVEASDVVHGRNFQTLAFDATVRRNAAEDAWRERRLILQALAAEIYALAIDISNQ